MKYFLWAQALLCLILIHLNGEIEAKKKEHPNNPSISARIIGGSSIAIENAPYQCSLQKVNIHTCGCAIINPNWILTAAHCLSRIPEPEPEYMEVVVGTSKWDEGGARHHAVKAIAHEKYVHDSYGHDIALIKLNQPISFNEKVQPIKYSTKVVPFGKSLKVSGWGLLWENGDWPDDLQTVNVTSASPENCKGVEGVDVDETHLCVTPSHGHGICNRDSGGPLVYENELVGIVNWAESCGVGPEGYAKISYFYDWIEEKLRAE